jgi:hypothetical protein
VNTSAITAEVARATSAEGVNTSAITAEVARATSAEGVNTSTITSEVGRATSAEGVNYSAITAEVARATSAEGVNTSAITSEVARAAANTNVWGAPGITPSPALLVNTSAIQTKNIIGGNLSGYRVIHVWVSTTDKGTASTNNIESLVLSTGTAVATVTANADYWYLTAAAGTAVATVTGTAVGTNYLMVVDGSSIGSSPITFVP